MIGLGGSSTNDGGAGMLAALGLRLLDASGADVAPSPAGLASLARVDAADSIRGSAQTSITIMSDVNNPLCGERGATAIFGPQKGVAPPTSASIDSALERYAALAERARARPPRRSRARALPADWVSRCSSSAAHSARAPRSSRT